MRREKSGRAARFCSPSDHILSRVTAPQQPMMASSFFPGHRHIFTSSSPLFPTSSLPATFNHVSSPQPEFSDPGELAMHENRFEFVSDLRETPQVYPSIVINGVIVDVNDVLREIINNRPPAPAVFDTEHNEVSLVCPLSYVPITAPGRGVNCEHTQCFDLAEFLILQGDEEWVCPICGIPLDFESLRFDPAFMKKQKQQQLETTEQVIFEESRQIWGEFELGF